MMSHAPRRPKGNKKFSWYDSYWLEKFEKAREWLELNRPDEFDAFVRSFDVFRTRADFQTRFFHSVFDDQTLTNIRSEIAALRPDQLELHEAKNFRRFIVHNLPYFVDLQRGLLPMASEAAGEALEIGYNFLSLYGERGVCPIHMDSPESKWTLDICIDQSAVWPIHFSKVQAWPDSKLHGLPLLPPEREALNEFDTYQLEPGQAVLFSGSSQWHYRDYMPSIEGKNFCHLLFFHFVPAGTKELVEPDHWQRLFNLDASVYA